MRERQEIEREARRERGEKRERGRQEREGDEREIRGSV